MFSLFRSKRRFPCPYCSKDVVVQSGRKPGSYSLQHRCETAIAMKEPNGRYKEALLAAFEATCKPQHIFGRVEGIDENNSLK